MAKHDKSQDAIKTPPKDHAKILTDQIIAAIEVDPVAWTAGRRS